MNYIVVLFKNKKRKKIFKSFVRKSIAEKFFNRLIDESNKVLFNIETENSEKVNYELGLLSSIDDTQIQLFSQDELGRNIRIEVLDSNYKIIKINNYNIPEKIQDWNLNKRISFDEFIKKYFSTKDLKNVFTIHNKLIIQQEETFSLFSLKNSNESKRLLQTLQQYFVSEKRADAIFVSDLNTIQRKYLYDMLVKHGFDKNKLYRQSTTFSKRK